MIEAIKRFFANFGRKLDEAGDKIEAKAEKAKDKVEDKWDDVKDKTAEKKEEIKDKSNDNEDHEYDVVKTETSYVPVGDEPIHTPDPGISTTTVEPSSPVVNPDPVVEVKKTRKQRSKRIVKK